MFHIVIAITAFWMLRHAFTEDHFKTNTAIYENAPPIRFSIDETLGEIKRLYPSFHAEFLTLPEAYATPAYFYGHTQGVSFLYANYYDEIQVDQVITPHFLKDKSLNEKLQSMIYPVHAGLYGNIFIKIIYCVGGLTPALLSITGFFLWWRRKYS